MRMLTNPLFAFIYFIFWRHLFQLCQYGNVKKNVPILAGCVLFFVIWIVVSLTRAKIGKESMLRIPKQWKVFAIILLIGITGFYGAKIVHAAIPYNGKLSWVLDDLKSKRSVTLKQDNIYEDGVEGIFTAIDQKVGFPKELYVNTTFDLKFADDGTILSFDTQIVGHSDDGKTKGYLITYDSKKSKDITVYLQDGKGTKCEESKRLKPFLELMERLDMKSAVNDWVSGSKKEFGILYKGIRNWKLDTAGLLYIDDSGKTIPADELHLAGENVNYTVSVYLPGLEETIAYCPKRFLLVNDWNQIDAANQEAAAILKQDHPEEADDAIKVGEYTELKDGTQQFFLNKKIGYRLVVADAAAGSRFYVFEKTTDGRNWTRINENPYAGAAGVAAGITFLDENLGFIALAHSGGDYGELYQTQDGGITFTLVTIPAVQGVATPDNQNPFDLPGMPYKEGGLLCMQVGQGADGDYNGGSKALYQSADNGNTWTYVREIQ